MGNGVPPTLPATESSWSKSQKIIDGLESAMLLQRKKETDPNALKTAITRANNHGFTKINTKLVEEAEYLLELVNHKFAEVKVGDYKDNWERAEAEKDPEGELATRIREEDKEKEEKAKRRKKPEKYFNMVHTNKTDCILVVENLPPDISEEVLRRHFDEYSPTPDVPDSASHCGNFTRINIVYDSASQCIGRAYVEFPDPKEKNRAIALDNTTLSIEPGGRVCKLTVKDPVSIPTPPQGNTIIRCVSFTVDGISRTVRAHFLPGFGELFKAPVSEQNVKDRNSILSYIESIRTLPDVTYYPSGDCILNENPMGKGKPQKRCRKMSIEKRSKVCTVCCGLETNHSNCYQSFAMAKSTVDE